jgi:hypothetical protein
MIKDADGAPRLRANNQLQQTGTLTLRRLDKEKVMCETIQDNRQTPPELDTIAWYDPKQNKLEFPIAVESLRGQGTNLTAYTSQFELNKPEFSQTYMCCSLLNGQVRKCVSMTPVVQSPSRSRAAPSRRQSMLSSLLLFALAAFLPLFAAF